jgi:hypothetical protein
LADLNISCTPTRPTKQACASTNPKLTTNYAVQASAVLRLIAAHAGRNAELRMQASGVARVTLAGKLVPQLTIGATGPKTKTATLKIPSLTSVVAFQDLPLMVEVRTTGHIQPGQGVLAAWGSQRQPVNCLPTGLHCTFALKCVPSHLSLPRSLCKARV